MIGDWGLGPIPKSPIPNPQSPTSEKFNVYHYVILNLNKFNKGKEELEDDLDEWLFALKNYI
jgi:hypothetical protein